MSVKAPLGEPWFTKFPKLFVWVLFSAIFTVDVSCRSLLVPPTLHFFPKPAPAVAKFAIVKACGLKLKMGP